MARRKKRHSLTHVERQEVYELWCLGEKVVPLAEAYNVSKATVSNVIHALHNIQAPNWNGAGRVVAVRNAHGVRAEPFQIPLNPPPLRTPNENTPGELARLTAFLRPPDSNGCRIFSGHKNADGYGMFWTGIKNEAAHRSMWRITFGEIPLGLYALHRCNTPPCCEPSHLWAGTQQQNCLQKVADGRDRSPRGEDHFRAKLTEGDVHEIFRLRQDYGLTLKELGDRFGVSNVAISAILTRRNWKHI